jgi:hypothetical protein
MRRLASLGLLLLCGCTVAEYPYPNAWDPLPVPESSDCREILGTYADRGESGSVGSTSPSLALQLLGPNSEWEKAVRVNFAFPSEGALQITIVGKTGPIFSRTLTSKDDEYLCKDGRARLRGRRWIATDLVSGRQTVVLEVSGLPKYLVTKVNEETYGTLFVLVPIAGTAQHWYRFPRVAQ